MEPITGLLDRIFFTDFLSKEEYLQREQIKHLHETRTHAIEVSKQQPKRQTKSAAKNKAKKQTAAKQQNELAKLLSKLSPAQREALINKAKGE